jgi:hydrogenase maturation protease
LKTIIIGLGNPSFSDDGAGCLVARALKNEIGSADVTCLEASITGLDVLNIIADFQKAIIVDAVQTQAGKPGSLYRVSVDQLSSSKEGSPHKINLITSLELAKNLGFPLPDSIILFGIEASDIDNPQEGCTPQVEAAIPGCVKKIMAEIEADQ